MIDEAVKAVRWPASNVVNRAVGVAVLEAVSWAAYDAGYGAVWEAVDWAVPAGMELPVLQDFLLEDRSASHCRQSTTVKI